jgi:DNA-binding CsgD family transcriptional regulator
MEQTSQERLLREMGPGAAAIGEVFSEIRQEFPDLAPPPELEPEQARFRLFESITTFLKNAARSQPLILVLDDLHWADRSSLLLLEFTAQRIRSLPLLVLGTYRDVELSMRHPLSQTLGNLVRERSYQKIQLRGFTPQDVEHFLEIAFGVKPSPGLVQAIHQQTEGNPLFVTEVVRLLGREGVEDEWSLATRIPEGIRDAIGRRMARLSDTCVQVLTTASVAGREFSFRLLESLRIAPEDMLLDVLEEALSAQFIEESPGEVGLYRFTHALIQEALAAELSHTRRVRLHARIAEALEGIYGVQAKAHATELAYHYGQAESLLGTEKLVRYSYLAGRQALASYAHDEALVHFQRGLEAKRQQSSSEILLVEAKGSRENMDAETADLTLGLGLSQIAILGLNRFREAVENLTCAFDYYIGTGDLSQALAIAQHPFPYWARQLPEVIRLIERTLAIVPPDSPQAGRLWSFYGQVLGVDRGDYAGAQEAFRRALAIAHQEEDATLKVRTLAWSAMTDCFHLRFTESLEKSLTAITLAQQGHDLQTEVDAYHWASVAMIITGDIAGANLKAAAGLNLAERIHDRQRLASLLWVNAGASQVRGEWEAGRNLSDRGLETWHQDPRLLGHRTVLEHQVGNFREGDHYLRQLVEVANITKSEPKAEHAILAMEIPLIARITGELKMGDICEDLTRALLSSPSTSPLVALIARIGMALLAVHREDAEEARRQYTALESILPGIIMVELSGDRLLGLLSHTKGDLDRATAHFEDALGFCRNSGCRPELAWTCFDYARVVLRRDATGDRIKALALLEESLSISDDLGMGPLTERAVALKQEVESQPPVAPTYPDGLTQREVEVLMLIAQGKSNREIADELIISPNTVISHVSNIFNKISVANRTEAATYANRHGLLSW